MVTTDFGTFDTCHDELHLFKGEIAVSHDVVSPTGRHAIARISQRVVRDLSDVRMDQT